MGRCPDLRRRAGPPPRAGRGARSPLRPRGRLERRGGIVFQGRPASYRRGRSRLGAAPACRVRTASEADGSIPSHRGFAMRSNRTALAALLLLSVLAAPAAAQEWAGRGRVRGEVKDDKGKPIAGASIYDRRGVEKIDPANPGDGPEVRTTDDKGRWTVAGITGGEWFALITKE